MHGAMTGRAAGEEAGLKGEALAVALALLLETERGAERILKVRMREDEPWIDFEVGVGFGSLKFAVRVGLRGEEQRVMNCAL